MRLDHSILGLTKVSHGSEEAEPETRSAAHVTSIEAPLEFCSEAVLELTAAYDDPHLGLLRTIKNWGKKTQITGR